MESESVAVIDLGTNTFHLLIAEIDEREDFHIREKYKEPVKLGEGGMSKGKISPRAFNRGIKALKKFRTMIDSRRAVVVRAFATSAIRSASNGAEFIEKARAEAGIEIRTINGNEEASLIFEGVRNGVHLPVGSDSLVMDIGGGSVEFIVVRDGRPMLLRSLNLGAARMLENVVPSDMITKKEIEKTHAFIREQAGGLLKELKEFNIRTIIGSSGTFETIGSIIARSKNDTLSSENLNNYRFRGVDFRKTYKILVSKNREDRSNIPGMDPLRVDMIVVGAILVDHFVNELEIKDFCVSTFALKEGILFSYISEQKERIQKFAGDTNKSVRAKAVRNLCKKFDYEKEHALTVSELALSLFDQLRQFHPFSSEERELLQYAALLHDIGKYINRSGHHKHGQYIITNSKLKGFSHDELYVLGNLVRYHRKSFPTRDHFNFKILEQHQRYMVRVLAGILRIADYLDRGHRALIDKLEVKSDLNEINIILHSTSELEMEIASAMAERGLLEQVFDRTVSITQAGK